MIPSELITYFESKISELANPARIDSEGIDKELAIEIKNHFDTYIDHVLNSDSYTESAKEYTIAIQKMKFLHPKDMARSVKMIEEKN